jgi:site-specific recombinase XerD
MAGVTDTTLFSLVHDYFRIHLPKMRNNSEHTIRSYQYSLESLFDYVKERKNINFFEITFEMIDHKMLAAYLEHLETERGCSITTRNQRLKCIRAFYSYAAKMKPVIIIHMAEIRKVPIKKGGKPEIVDYMTEAAVAALLNQPDVTTKKGLRDQFIMLILYDTAARVEELVDIHLNDIRLGKTPTVTLHGKFNKVRTIPLMEKTVEHYKNYMKAYHSDEDAYSSAHLFYTTRHKIKNRMSENNVRELVASYAPGAQKVCAEAPDKVHPHLFRHSRAMHLYQQGMDLTLLSQWLGHAQLDTTLMYAYADTEMKRRAIEASTSHDSPLKKKLNANRFTIDNEDTLKKLYGFR